MTENGTALAGTFTFLGEELLGIFAVGYEFAWDFPQQLNDQCDVICGEEDRKINEGKVL